MPPKKQTTPAPRAKAPATKGSKGGATTKTAKPAAPPPVVVTTANETMSLKQLTGVLAPNPELGWCKSGKWPCILDPNGTAATFLRYRNTNMLEAMNKSDLEAEKIRLALLGSLRFGKPFVIDMGDADMFNVITAEVENLQPGLMAKILNKEMLQESNFITLVESTDSDDYRPDKFTGGLADQFVFIILMTGSVPPPNGSDKMYYILLE